MNSMSILNANSVLSVKRVQKISFSTLSLVSVLILFTASCSHVLKHGEPIENGVRELIHNAPPGESYPDAGIIYILQEKTEEALEDGTRKHTLHKVFKIINEGRELSISNGSIF
jgi:hypothetical protein